MPAELISKDEWITSVCDAVRPRIIELERQASREDWCHPSGARAVLSYLQRAREAAVVGDGKEVECCSAWRMK